MKKVKSATVCALCYPTPPHPMSLLPAVMQQLSRACVTCLPSPPCVNACPVLDYEHVFVDALPSAERYERSYMHRDRVTHTVVCPNTDFIVTGRCGGVH